MIRSCSLLSSRWNYSCWKVTRKPLPTFRKSIIRLYGCGWKKMWKRFIPGYMTNRRENNCHWMSSAASVTYPIPRPFRRNTRLRPGCTVLLKRCSRHGDRRSRQKSRRNCSGSSVTKPGMAILIRPIMSIFSSYPVCSGVRTGPWRIT